MLRVMVPPLVLLVILGALLAHARGRELVPDYLWLSLLLYPVWGLVQQWLVQALVVDPLRDWGLGTVGLVLVGAVGFGAVHLAHPPLAVATAVMGGCYVLLFQRWRNLWPLAVCHGWLGSLFYPWVLDRNPLGELIGPILG